MTGLVKKIGDLGGTIEDAANILSHIKSLQEGQKILSSTIERLEERLRNTEKELALAEEKISDLRLFIESRIGQSKAEMQRDAQTVAISVYSKFTENLSQRFDSQMDRLRDQLYELKYRPHIAGGGTEILLANKRAQDNPIGPDGEEART